MRALGPWLSLIFGLTAAACIPSTSDRRATAPGPVAQQPAAAQPPVVSVPRWQAQTVEVNAQTIASSSYTVQPGDTLNAIVRQTGAGVGAIARTNNIEPPYIIHPGQRLTIPGGRYHEVRGGETGIAISRAYGVDWSQVATLNQIEEPYILRIGQRIQLPTDAEVAAMSREERAAAFDLDIDDIITGGQPAIAEDERPAAPVRTASVDLPPDAAVRSPANFTGRFGWPLTGPIVGNFGAGGSGQQNNGINIGATRGTPVLASADGTVLYSGDEIAVHGGLVLISHGDGWITAYANMEDLQVTRGQRVERGQMIARAGDTGNAPQPQLHFEIRRNRRPVDPTRHLPNLS